MHLVFLSGLPRSGTSLLAEFFGLHEEVHLIRGDNHTNEVRAIRGSPAYGGSTGCLRPMCEEYLRRSERDTRRINVSNYLVPTTRPIIAVKEPAGMLLMGPRNEACLARGLRCSFVNTVIDLDHWQVPEYGCANTCRAQIKRYGARCYERMRSYELGTEIQFARFGDVSTWRSLERHFGLRPIPVAVVHQRRLYIRRSQLPDFIVQPALLNSHGCRTRLD